MKTLTAREAAGLIPVRPADGHKGTFGHLLVLAGSRGMTGAARLVCEGAYRTGTGLVTLGIPEQLSDAVAPALLETMHIPLPGAEPGVFSANALTPAIEAVKARSALVIGPGMGQSSETSRFVQGMLQACNRPAVVDADALNIVGEGAADTGARMAPRILTPHPGEMARLTGQSVTEIQGDREGVAQRFAREWDVTLVLKGHRTVIAAKDGRGAVNPTGDTALAKGGTGDVLSGIIGGLAAQGCDPFDAARLAVYLHGLAGALAAAELSARAVMARDILAALPRAWKQLETEDIP